MDYRRADEVISRDAAHRDGNVDEHLKYDCSALHKLNEIGTSDV